VYESRVLAAIEGAWRAEQLKIYVHRKDYDRAMTILSTMEYPDDCLGGSEVFRIAAGLEKKYPEQVLAFYLSGLPECPHNPTRKTYARWAQAARRARHMWVDVLGKPTKWETFAKQLKSANLRRPTFQQEFAKVVPGWSQL